MNNYIERIASFLAALILLQTLYFKFSAAPESVFIFGTLGLEPYGRIATGIAELIVSLLLIIPKTSHFGALFGFIIMLGAIFSHLFIIGVEVQNDHGILFVMAVIVLICSLIIIFLKKEKLVGVFKLIGERNH